MIHLISCCFVLVASCPVFVQAAERSDAELIARIDASLAKAGAWLVDHQSPDGAWRSEVYGMFRDGQTLTPYVMNCLFFLPQAGDETAASYRRGVDYLAGLVGDDGQIDLAGDQLLFPVYTAASASRAVALQDRTARNLRAQQAWLAVVRRRQLDESLGWAPDDPEYGGWGFSLRRPQKPAPGQLRERFFESNLSATIFALAALRSARMAPDDPAYRRALIFVGRCQNFAENPDRTDPRYDDGGFVFLPGDPVQNKAGIAGEDRFGRVRFHSYGTMTADGARALLACGLPPDHPRVVAAREWLKTHFSAEHNPGTFEPERAILQDATYYYWVWAVSHALMALGVDELDGPSGRVDWARALAEEVLRRQETGGIWRNLYTDAREDDPMVSTPWAAASLAVCRLVMTGEYQTLNRSRATGAFGRPLRKISNQAEIPRLGGFEHGAHVFFDRVGG